ncbi:MAG: gamma-glutamylcyclotransferase [Gammaproteobacteria bacterium]|nr:gamma-glutamylcyclotransferase [Gammaproteobacteria bacterium]TVQ44334.1 MAG: gamma-glutamylcyclotransferase [Gammaproteobacteria bacterium]
MVERVFVYGSLRRGAPGGMARLLRPGSQPLGGARLRGRLLHLGAYPGLLPGGSGWVRGELHRLTDPLAVLQRLDRYEGCASAQPAAEFRRVELEVLGPAGQRLTAWVYLYTGCVGGRSSVPSGDWLSACRTAVGPRH